MPTPKTTTDNTANATSLFIAPIPSGCSPLKVGLQAQILVPRDLSTRIPCVEHVDGRGKLRLRRREDAERRQQHEDEEHRGHDHENHTPPHAEAHHPVSRSIGHESRSEYGYQPHGKDNRKHEPEDRTALSVLQGFRLEDPMGGKGSSGLPENR